MKRKTLYEGKYVRLMSEKTWEYSERVNCCGIVIILAVTKKGKVIFIEQLRVPVGKKVIEFPAGLVSDEGRGNESFEEAALRELWEETGYSARSVKHLMTGPANPGMSRDHVSFYLAEGLKKEHEGGGDESESITVHEIPLAKADLWLRKMEKKGYLIDPKVYAGLYFLKNQAASRLSPVRQRMSLTSS